MRQAKATASVNGVNAVNTVNSLNTQVHEFTHHSVVQKFTFANLVFSWLLGSVLSGLQSLAHQLLGAGRAETFEEWFSRYGANQLKFTFWFFYLSAIRDDLGIPNFKTLGRLLARSFLHRIKKPLNCA